MADLAKVKPDELGINPQALSTVNPVVQAIEQSIAKPQAEREAMLGARMLRDQSTFLRTPPSAGGVASPNVFSGPVPGSTTAQGIVPRVQTSTAPPVAVAHERFTPEGPRTYEPDFVTLNDGTKVITQNKLDDVHLQIALADAQARSEGRPDTKAVNAQGMKWLTDNLSPGAGGARREMINGNAATSFGGGIAPKTTVQPGYAPQLKTPFDNPKAFATITGYRGDNPIYSSGAAEMTAANAGIAEYNKAAVDKFGAENTLYSTVTGGVPLQQAQALLAGTSAAEMPGENKSQQGFRSAQSKEALANASLLSAKAAVAGDPEPPKPHFGEIESIGQGGMTKTPYVSYVDREGNLQVKTQQGAQGSFAAVAASLTPEQKSIAAKHMKKGQTQEEQTSIFTKVKNGELK